MTAEEALRQNAVLARRAASSQERLKEIRRLFSEEVLFQRDELMVFGAGSLGRGECGEKSDLDLFVTASAPLAPIVEIPVLARLISLNQELGFPPFSAELRYLKVYDTEGLIRHTGKPIDDSENFFTTRMLLLLESVALCNQPNYEELCSAIVGNYFRDNKGKKNFRPLFLINDLLRYWRTLCLNYEERREDPTKPWRKRNINLKFSRLITVFSTIGLLQCLKPQTAGDVLPLISLSPLRRLARMVDTLSDARLSAEFPVLLDHYVSFLQAKDEHHVESVLGREDVRQRLALGAEFVADFMQRSLTHPSIGSSWRYLLL